MCQSLYFDKKLKIQCASKKFKISVFLPSPLQDEMEWMWSGKPFQLYFAFQQQINLNLARKIQITCTYKTFSLHSIELYLGQCIATDAEIKYHRLGGLNNRNLLPPSPGGWTPQIKVWAELVSSSKGSEGGWVSGLLLWLVDGVLLLVSLHIVFSVCVSLPKFPLIRAPVVLDGGPPNDPILTQLSL